MKKIRQEQVISSEVKVSVMLTCLSDKAVVLEMIQLAFAMQEKCFPVKFEAKAISKNNHAHGNGFCFSSPR